jgi:hypothetical protein
MYLLALLQIQTKMNKKAILLIVIASLSGSVSKGKNTRKNDSKTNHNQRQTS